MLNIFRNGMDSLSYSNLSTKRTIKYVLKFALERGPCNNVSFSRQYQDRLAIKKKSLRVAFKKWILRKLPKSAEKEMVENLRRDNRSIYVVVRMIQERFPNNIPDGIVDLLLCLYAITILIVNL